MMGLPNRGIKPHPGKGSTSETCIALQNDPKVKTHRPGKPAPMRFVKAYCLAIPDDTWWLPVF